MSDHPAELAPSLAEACRRWWDRPAITYGAATWSYGELWRRVSGLAAFYQGLGVGPGDRVVCQLPNCPDHVAAIAAAWHLGAVHVGTDHDLTGPELAWLVANTGASVLLFRPRPGDDDPFGPLDAVRRSCPDVEILTDGVGPKAPRTHVLGDVADGPEPGPAPPAPPPAGPPAPDDTAVLLLTSGTTGRPKAIMESLTHGWAKMQFFADAFMPGPDDVHLLYLPMAHVFGLRLGLIALLRGGRLVLMERFSPEGALRLVAQESVTVLPGMPTHLTLLVGRLDPARHDVSTLRWVVSAAAALPAPLATQVYEKLAERILFVYGCSEGFTTLTTDRQEILAGSVGKVVFRGPPGTPPNGAIRVVAPDGEPVGPGEVGEITFGAAVPVRYWGEPPAAGDGWYHSGDLGRVDADGGVYVMGRLKELVNRGGLKVSPTEVETAIVRHPGVIDAAVVATPDPVLGEATCACVVASGAEALTLGGLRSFLSDTLARHKLPDELCFVEGIPRTKIGKVDRPALVSVVTGAGATRERLRP